MARDEQPTAAAAPEGIVATLAELSEQMNVPDGYHVEIIAGRIVVSPTPQLGHAKIVRRLEEALEPALPPGTDYYQNVTIVVADTGEQYVPDLLVLPADIPDDQWRFDAGMCLLVVEVTSPKDPETDRNMKLRGYATAGVPLYLLIDVDRRSVTLFSLPSESTYRKKLWIEHGEKIHLPEPFDVTIDTAEFPFP